MKYSPADLSARLKAEGEALQEFFHNLPKGNWCSPVYIDDDIWRVCEVLVHFSSAELALQALIRNVADGGDGVSEDFDIQAFNHMAVSSTDMHDTVVLLAQFAMIRERTVALVEGLSPEQLEITGRHPFLGVVPLGEMVRAIYHHNNMHMRDVRGALRAAGTGSLGPKGD